MLRKLKCLLGFHGGLTLTFTQSDGRGGVTRFFSCADCGRREIRDPLWPKIKCGLGFHSPAKNERGSFLPYVREERVSGEVRRWWSCGSCGREYWLPAEH